jgi:hypothetical protein
MIQIAKKLAMSLASFGAALVLSAAALWAALWAGYQAAIPPPPALSAWAPQGALLAIEAKDFAALLKDWTGSHEQRAWLASDNYAEFSRSRLFARLGEAQQQFAQSAGLPPDLSFLNQVAGEESLFAWYDIGKLEFLYITRLPGNAAEQTALFQQRSKFETRKAGAETFYLRSNAGASVAADSAAPDSNEGGDQSGPTRTVAFALHGDYLLLATREDLIANALLLMQGQRNLDLRDEHWYAASTAAANRPSGDLRMTLNLAAIVPSPYFRSYWLQQDITQMKQYSAAEADLYRAPDSFREERVLLPKSPAPLPAADLAPALAFLPPAAGVYRATANPATDQIVAALEEKLLFREIAAFRDARFAPVVDVSPLNVGSASDLETRIDIPPPPAQPLGVALAPLRSLLDAARVDAMLVTSSSADAMPPAAATGKSASAEASGRLFLPIRSTIVLSSPAPWNAEALQSALAEALRARLTAGDNGLRWERRSLGKLAWFELEGLQPLAFAMQGKVCVLASDSETLLKSLAHSPGAKAPEQTAAVAAGFNHAAERPRFARITALLDKQSLRQADPQQVGPQEDGAPGFFAKNLRSLSDTFQALESETFVERPDAQANVVRQTVVYQWKR